MEECFVVKLMSCGMKVFVLADMDLLHHTNLEIRAEMGPLVLAIALS